jgi:thioredoxin reductase (NADPH)
MTDQIYDVIILGGGPAGLTAAIYTSRAELTTLIVAGQPSGGQLMWTTEVENYPGFPEGIQGPELIANFKKQSQRFKATSVEENVTSLTGSFKEGFKVRTDSNNEYSGKTVIIATGASAKWLPLESVERLKGKGVSACATCDGFFFKDKTTAVVGAGDAAMEEANFLTKFSPKVYVLVRGSKEDIKASRIMQERAMKNERIEFIFNVDVKEVLGENSVEGVILTNNKTNEEQTLEIQGLFMAIGHKPNTDFLDGLLPLGKDGYIEPTDNTKTPVEGLFVAGDVGDWKYRQAVTAAGFGCMAALDAEKFLAEQE